MTQTNFSRSNNDITIVFIAENVSYDLTNDKFVESSIQRTVDVSFIRNIVTELFVSPNKVYYVYESNYI